LRLRRIRLPYIGWAFLFSASYAYAQGISRPEILDLAHRMVQYNWSPLPQNLIGKCGSPGQYVAGKSYLGLPYVYGGNDGILRDGSNEFEAKLKGKQFQVVGDDATRQRSCAAGIDCSSYISHSWGLKGRAMTVGTISGLARQKEYTSLEPGDAITFGEHHVVLVEQVLDTPVGPRVKVCQAHQHNELTNCDELLSFKDIQNARYWEYKHVDEDKVTASSNTGNPAPPKDEAVTLTPNILNFGKVDLGKSKSLAVSISNGSETTLTASIANPTDRSQEFLIGRPVDIKGHSTAPLAVSFAPSTTGNHVLSMEIRTGQLRSKRVTLIGEGTTHCLTAELEDPLALLRLDRFAAHTTRSEYGVSIKNCGTEPVTVTRILFGVNHPWLLKTDSTLPQIVGSRTEAEVRFSILSEADEDLSGQMLIRSDTAEDVAVRLQAHVLASCLRLPMSSRLIFGDVVSTEKGQDRSIILAACGESDVRNITVTQTDSSNSFSISGIPDVLSAGSSRQLDVHLNPVNLGDQRGVFQFKADGIEPLPFVVTANVSGCLSSDKKTLKFQTGFPHRRKLEVQVVVSNCGEAPLRITAWAKETNKFSVVAVDRPNVVLTVGHAQTVNVTFSANRKGAWSDALVIGWSDPHGASNNPIIGAVVPITGVVRRKHWWSLR
jgi:hypothetical protein